MRKTSEPRNWCTLGSPKGFPSQTKKNKTFSMVLFALDFLGMPVYRLYPVKGNGVYDPHNPQQLKWGDPNNFRFSFWLPSTKSKRGTLHLKKKKAQKRRKHHYFWPFILKKNEPSESPPAHSPQGSWQPAAPRQSLRTAPRALRAGGSAVASRALRRMDCDARHRGVATAGFLRPLFVYGELYSSQTRCKR